MSRVTATKRRFSLLALLTAVLASLIFLPGLPGEFVFDDIPNIVNNTSIQLEELTPGAVADLLATKQVSGHGRTLPTLTFALDYWRAGGVADPGRFKVTNLLIHGLTAFVLAWLFHALLLAAGAAAGRARWLAPALALAWAAHPLQVSSVLYAVQRLQTLGTLFLVSALLAYLHGRLAQIRGASGKTGLLGAILFWALALACKEDSALLPAYTLALELTVLGFAAANTRVVVVLKRGYALAVVAAVLVYLLLVLPHYWSWEPYGGRDFNSAERLLTQARVLCLYLWQILLPLPGHMPFFYDWVQPSRGLLAPWTTLPAIGLIITLLALAWRLRRRRPLLALGVFLFFFAHAITGNVVGLELAYEHRNHLALIGAVLAIGDGLGWATQSARLGPIAVRGLCAVLLVSLMVGTLIRAHSWRSNVALSEAATAAAPQSPRAWIELCDARIKAGGGAVIDNPHLDDAIRACESGANSNPDTLNSLALLVVLKTVRGDVHTADWERFHARLASARMSWDNMRAPLIFGHYASLGVNLDRAQVLQAFATLDRCAQLKPGTLVYIGEAIMDNFADPDRAVPYLVKALEQVPPGDAYAWEMAGRLRASGRPDLARAIERASLIEHVEAPPEGDIDEPAAAKTSPAED